MITALLLLAIAGLGALWFELRRSVKGYEDDVGFHAGVDSAFRSFNAQAVVASWTDDNSVKRSSKGGSESGTMGQGMLRLS